MKRSHLWVLNPCLLAMLSTSAWAEEQKEENIVVSASRAHRSVAEMAQTTWVIERAEIEQQVQGGKEIKEVLAQLIPGMDVSSTTAVRMAVARVELTPSMPIFARIEVRAANTADPSA